MNDAAKNGIGCGVLFLLFVLGFAALDADTLANIMTWGIALSIPLGIARFMFRNLFEDYGWWIWGTMWAGAIVLGFVAPIKTSGEAEKPSEPDKGMASGAVRVSAEIGRAHV